MQTRAGTICCSPMSHRFICRKRARWCYQLTDAPCKSVISKGVAAYSRAGDSKKSTNWLWLVFKRTAWKLKVRWGHDENSIHRVFLEPFFCREKCQLVPDAPKPLAICLSTEKSAGFGITLNITFKAGIATPNAQKRSRYFGLRRIFQTFRFPNPASLTEFSTVTAVALRE